jgi:hypothetical protein
VNNNFQDIQRKLAVNLKRKRRKALICQEELAFKADELTSEFNKFAKNK